jgi:hypothetical protein
MSFLSPIFLFGLPLIAIPIGIHLLNRRQQKVLNWGAMRFLVSATTRRRRLWRMSDLLLLLLRVLAILFIVGALARPLLPVTWLGHNGPRAVVLVIDTSLSMSATEDGVSLFNQLLQKTDTILDGLSPSDSLQVVIARDNPVWLQENPVEANPNEIRRLRGEIRRLEPTLGSTDLPSAIYQVFETPEDDEKMIRIINVLTDGQAHGWSIEEGTPWAEIKKKVEEQKRPTLVNLDLIEHTLSEQPNLSVDELSTVRSVTAIQQPVTVEALIQNRGAQASPASVLHWYIEDQSLGISSIAPLSPGSSTAVKITHAFEFAGHFDLWCQIDSRDPLEADDEAHLIFTITDQVPVLIVDGSSATDPLQTDVGYLLASLGYQEDETASQETWQSGFAPKIISIADLEKEPLDPFRCVIMANPRRLTRTEFDKVKQYVQDGGGLWLAAGDAITAEEFNDTWYRDGVGLSPLPLVTTIGDTDDRDTFTRLQPPSESHAATQLLADLQRLDIDRVQIFRHHQFDELSALDTSILLKLDHGDALAVEQTVGQGRCIILGTPLGLAWSNFPVCQSYVAMVHEWIWYLAAPSFPRHNLALGESIQVNLPEQTADVSIQLPNNETSPLRSGDVDKEKQVRFSGTQIPGIYTVTAGQNGFRSPFHIARDPNESNLKKLSSTELAQIADTPGFQIGGNRLEIPRDLDLEIPTTPIANTLLMTLLALVVGELLLAAWCTHQRNPQISAVTMEG